MRKVENILQQTKRYSFAIIPLLNSNLKKFQHGSRFCNKTNYWAKRKLEPLLPMK